MGRFEAGMQRWADRLIAARGVTVTYGRGVASIEIQAVPGSTSFDAADASGFWSIAHADDFLVRPGDLVLGSVLIDPADGDWLRRTYGGHVVTYTVRPLGDRCYRELPPYGVLLRVHAKMTKREAA